jgi:two-component system NarL family sensor kinase
MSQGRQGAEIAGRADKSTHGAAQSDAMGRPVELREALARGALVLSVAFGVTGLLTAILLRPTFLNLLLAVVAVLVLPVTLVGAAAVRARAGGLPGWLLLAAGVALPLATSAYIYAGVAFARDLPGAAWAGWLDGWPWIPAVVLVPTIGVLLYPDGRLPSKRWLPVLLIDLAVALCLVLWTVLGTDLIDFPHQANPTALPGAAGRAMSATFAAIALVAPMTTVSAVAATLRWRRLRGTTRGHGIGLVVPAAWGCALSWWGCVVVTSVVGDSDSVAAAPFESAGMLAVAIACWIGIRRYGLLDVRVVLGRVAVYTVLTAAVVVVYVVVAAIVATVATRASGPIGAAVALLIALPLRELLQRQVNRLVFGDRDDPARAIDRLGQRLADAADTEQVLDTVAVVIRDALRLASVGIDVRGVRVAAAGPSPAVAESSALADGQRIELPLVFAGERIGQLLADPGAERILTVGEQRLLADLARQVASAAHAVTLTGDLARSHERLVGATEEERRRLRRDLHDGLGPTLAGIVLGLQRARSRVPTDPGAAQADLDSLTRQAQGAVSDVRRLVYGLRPPAVDDLGLVGAIREQAQAMGGVEVQGQVDGDLSAAVEVAAYRIALEAMTNAVRHGGGRWCRVRLELNGALHVVVEDDGVGFPDQYRAGVGITSMRERASELGGTCSIARREPTGTTVHAVLPTWAAT